MNSGDVGSGLPPMQEGMLFHSLSAEDHGLYLLQAACRLSSSLDIALFEKAWNDTIARHEALRTSFHWDQPGSPYQQVQADVHCPLECFDWQDVSSSDIDALLQEFLRNERTRDFDLSSAPLMRLSLIRLPENEYLFVWTCHHALLDGRSRTAVLKEVASRYKAFSNGQAAELAPCTPFQEYVEWFPA